MPFPPVLTRMSGRVPAVEVYFSALPAGTASVTVWRIAAGREMRVRGAVKAATAGQLTRVDYEVPFGVPVAYRAECFNSSGVRLSYTDQATVTVNVAGLWVHNPLDPQGAVACDFRDRALEKIQAPNDGNLLRVPGQRAGVFLAGTQQGVTDVDLSIAVDSIADRDAVLEMLGRGAKNLPPILCFRFGAEINRGLPRPFYAVTPDYSMQDVDVLYGGSTTHFEGGGSEVEPPVPGLFVPLLTYGDLKRAYATYGALKADNLTYGAVNRRYDKAVS